MQLDPEQLLAHEPYLRDLARSLVRDGNAASDLVQQAWLRALERPPREPGRLKAWLARVVRNFAKETNRSDRRRRVREVTVARSEPLPAVDHFVDRESRRRTVVAAVLALPEPYRATIVWRFFDGIDAVDIARRLDVPPSTVRNRIHRGLQLLRKQLDDSHGGNRRAWCTALTPLCSFPPAFPFVALSSGALIVKKTIILAAAVLSIAALGFWMWNAEPAAHRVAEVGERAPERATSAAPALDAASSSAPASVVQENVHRTGGGDAESFEVAARHLAAFRGRVVGPDGTPAAGAPISIIGFDGKSAFLDALTASGRAPTWRGDARSGADGRFEVRRVRPGSEHVLLAGAGTPLQTAQLVARTPAPGETVDLGDVMLTKKAKASGRILDPDGKPVAGAWIRSVRTGGATLDQYIRGVRLDLLDPRGCVALQRPEREGGERSMQILEMPPWVEGVYRALGIPEAFSAADGTFELFGLEPRANMIIASKAGFVSAYRTPVSPGSLEEAGLGDIKLDRGTVIYGHVEDADGRPVAGADVMVGPTSFDPSLPVHLLIAIGKTDASGKFTSGGFTPRDVVAAARRSPSDPWTAAEPQPYAPNITIKLPSAGELTIQITGAARAPQLRLYEGEAKGETLVGGFARAVDASWKRTGDGEWSSGPLPKAIYTVRASAEQCADAVGTIDLRHENRLRLELVAGASLDVAVTDAAGAPLGGAAVELYPSIPPEWLRSAMPRSFSVPHAAQLPIARAATSSSGRVRLDRATLGEAHLVVRHPAYSENEQIITIPSGARSVALAPRPTLAGQVTAGGDPVTAPRTVRIRRLDDDYIAPAGTGLTVTTDSAGKFRVQTLAPGAYEVSSRGGSPSGGAALTALDAMLAPRRADDARRTRFVLEAGRTTDVVHEEMEAVAAPGEEALSVAGTVLLNGRAGAGLSVNLVVHDDEQVIYGRHPGLTATLDASGRFRFDRVKSVKRGSVWFVVRDPESDLVLHSTRIEARAPETRIDLNIPTAEVRGRVVDARGAGAACSIHIQGTTDAKATASLDTAANAAGEFTIRCLPTGTYEFQTLARGGNSRNKSIVLAPGPNTVELHIFPYNSISGTVDLSRVTRGADTAVWLQLFMVDGPVNYNPTALVGDDGSFSLTGVWADVYEARVFADGAWYKDPNRIELKDAPLRGVRVTLEPGGAPEIPLPPLETSKAKALLPPLLHSFSPGFEPGEKTPIAPAK